jgi:uncharacterized repeat protein (TIGR01451 family)
MPVPNFCAAPVSGIRGPRLLRVGAAAAMTLLGPAAGTAAAADTTPAPRAHAGFPADSAGSARSVSPALPALTAAPAGVTVAVLGGSTPADEHAAIDYTIELRDAANVPYRNVAVTALLPPGFHVVRASPAADGPARGAASATLPTWTADLVPGRPVEIHAEITAGTVQDLASAPEVPTGPSDVIDDSPSGGMAWYSLSACAQSGADGVPVCGLSRQLLLKTDDDTRRGIEAIVLILGVPLVVAGLGVYAWRAWRDPEPG